MNENENEMPILILILILVDKSTFDVQSKKPTGSQFSLLHEPN